MWIDTWADSERVVPSWWFESLRKKLFIYFYFWLRSVFVAAHRVCPVAASGGYCVVLVHRLLIVVASLVAEHGL